MLDRKGASRGIVKALKNNELVAMLIDHHPKRNEKAIITKFFDEDTDFTPSSSIIAKKFNAIIIPVFIIKDKKNNLYNVEFHKAIDTSIIDNISEIMQLQVNAIENVIKDVPEEWFWFHKRWKNIKNIYL
jgi:KDO2-lipid IV(A) lauroyltransferase